MLDEDLRLFGSVSFFFDLKNLWVVKIMVMNDIIDKIIEWINMIMMNAFMPASVQSDFDLKLAIMINNTNINVSFKASKI